MRRRNRHVCRHYVSKTFDACNTTRVALMEKLETYSNPLCSQIVELAQRNSDVRLLWLYGSRGIALKTDPGREGQFWMQFNILPN